jgi:DNA-directed RNA polymerase specialized sigma24 family protein
MSTKEFRSSDLKRIVAIARPAIIAAFNERRFKFSSGDIEEVNSMMLVKVAQSWDRYDENISATAWFATIAYNSAHTYMTREGKWRCHRASLGVTTKDGEFYEVEYSDREAPRGYHADDAIISEQRTAAIKKAVDRLGPEAGEAIWLQANGYSLPEIVEIKGTGYGATKTMMSRARKQLKENGDICIMYAEIFGRNYNDAA